MLKYSHLTEVVNDSPKGLTYYFFEVWTLEIDSATFLELSAHNQVVVTSELEEASFSKHCRYLVPTQEKIELPETQWLRVSMAGLVNITYQGKTVLFKGDAPKPFGGAYYFYPSWPLLSVVELEKEESKDLRFSIEKNKLEELRIWFNSKRDREIKPIRELKEEFTEENEILSPEAWRKLELTF